MLTATLQLVSGAVSLLFGVLAAWVAHQPAAAFRTPARRLAWWTTGVTFVAVGLASLVSSGWSMAAFLAGPESTAWEMVLRWRPVMTFSRVGLILLLAAALLRMSLHSPREGRAYRRRYAAALASALLLGGALGGWLAPMRGMGGSYYLASSVANLLEVLLLLGALWAGMLRDVLGRELWLALCAYALVLALNVVWLSGMAWIDVPLAWQPKPYLSQVYTIAAYLLMIALAARKLSLARRGIHAARVLDPIGGG